MVASVGSEHCSERRTACLARLVEVPGYGLWLAVEEALDVGGVEGLHHARHGVRARVQTAQLGLARTFCVESAPIPIDSRNCQRDTFW